MVPIGVGLENVLVVILLLVLKPSNVTIQGQPNPQRISVKKKKMRLEICFPTILLISNLFFWCVQIGLGSRCFVVFSSIVTQQRLEFGNALVVLSIL